MTKRSILRAYLGVFACATIVGSIVAVAQQSRPASAPSSAASGRLRVSGVGLKDTTFDEKKFASLPRATVIVKDKDGADQKFEGVRAADLLMAAGMKFGHSLRGERLADYLIAEAADGYRVIFALTELDAEFSDRIVLVADRCNGAALDVRDGPLRIIVSDEKKHARWVRNTIELRIESTTKSAK